MAVVAVVVSAVGLSKRGMGRRRCRSSLIDRLLDTSNGVFVAGPLLGDSSVVSLIPSTAVVSSIERSAAFVIDSFLAATLREDRKTYPVSLERYT